MLAVTREIGQQTAKACGAKSLCDRQMILFATAVPMQQHKGGLDLAPRCQCEPCALQFGAQLVPFQCGTGIRDWFAQQARRGAAHKRLDAHAVLLSVAEDLAVVVLQLPARRTKQAAARQPCQYAEGDNNEGAANEQEVPQTFCAW